MPPPYSPRVSTPKPPVPEPSQWAQAISRITPNWLNRMFGEAPPKPKIKYHFSTHGGRIGYYRYRPLPETFKSTPEIPYPLSPYSRTSTPSRVLSSYSVSTYLKKYSSYTPKYHTEYTKTKYHEPASKYIRPVGYRTPYIHEYKPVGYSTRPVSYIEYKHLYIEPIYFKPSTYKPYTAPIIPSVIKTKKQKYVVKKLKEKEKRPKPPKKIPLYTKREFQIRTLSDIGKPLIYKPPTRLVMR